MAEAAMTGVMLAASYFDWRTKKIPNRLLLMGLLPLVIALLQCQDMLWRLLFMGLVFLLCWPLYLCRGLGAGDVKLLVLLAGICGLSGLFVVSFIAFLLAALFSVIKMRHTVILAPFFTLGYVLLLAGRWWM